MSFGFSPSDIVALINIVSKTYQGWKKACGEYADVTATLDNLLIILKRIEDESKRPSSILVRTQKDAADLKGVLSNTTPTVRELHAIVERYKSLGLGKSREKNWDKIRFGVRNLNDMRSKLNQHLAALSTYLNTVGLSSLTRIERGLETLPQIKKTVDALAAEIRAGRREGTVMTTYEDDEKEVWKQFRRELVGEGMKSNVIHKFKPQIRAYLRALAERGELEEQSVGEDDSDIDSAEVPEDPTTIQAKTTLNSSGRSSRWASKSKTTRERQKMAMQEEAASDYLRRSELYGEVEPVKRKVPGVKAPTRNKSDVVDADRQAIPEEDSSSSNVRYTRHSRKSPKPQEDAKTNAYEEEVFRGRSPGSPRPSDSFLFKDDTGHSDGDEERATHSKPARHLWGSRSQGVRSQQDGTGPVLWDVDNVEQYRELRHELFVRQCYANENIDPPTFAHEGDLHVLGLSTPAPSEAGSACHCDEKNLPHQEGRTSEYVGPITSYHSPENYNAWFDDIETAQIEMRQASAAFTARADGEIVVNPRVPTYPKVHTKYLDIETLVHYDIPYEHELQDSAYIIILKEMGDFEVDVLFKHTRDLWKSDEYQEPEPVVQRMDDSEKEYKRRVRREARLSNDENGD